MTGWVEKAVAKQKKALATSLHPNSEPDVERRHFFISYLHLLQSHPFLFLTYQDSLCLASFIHVLWYIVVALVRVDLFVDLSKEPVIHQ